MKHPRPIIGELVLNSCTPSDKESIPIGIRKIVALTTFQGHEEQITESTLGKTKGSYCSTALNAVVIIPPDNNAKRSKPPDERPTFSCSVDLRGEHKFIIEFFGFTRPLLDRFVRRFGVNVSFFSIGAVICSVPAFLFLGIPFRIFHPPETKNGLIAVIVLGIYSAFYRVL